MDHEARRHVTRERDFPGARRGQFDVFTECVALSFLVLSFLSYILLILLPSFLPAIASILTLSVLVFILPLSLPPYPTHYTYHYHYQIIRYRCAEVR